MKFVSKERSVNFFEFWMVLFISGLNLVGFIWKNCKCYISKRFVKCLCRSYVFIYFMCFVWMYFKVFFLFCFGFFGFCYFNISNGINKKIILVISYLILFDFVRMWKGKEKGIC